MLSQIGKDESNAMDGNQLVKHLADSEVELQKCQSSCRELEDRVGALDADNCQLKAQLAVSNDQIDRIQHQLIEDHKVCLCYCLYSVVLWNFSVHRVSGVQ